MILPEVKKLLQQYEEYKKVSEHTGTLSRRLAVAKVTGSADDELQAEYDRYSKKLQAISDAITYASPFVWIQYKNEAYKDEAQPIKTMHDFRVHCSKPGYICTKRFEFLNNYLAGHGSQPLTNTTLYPDELAIAQLLHDKTLASLEYNETFMKQWRSYEYYKESNRVAKWENWQ